MVVCRLAHGNFRSAGWSVGVLGDGAKKARTLAQEKIEKVKEVIGLTKIS